MKNFSGFEKQLVKEMIRLDGIKGSNLICNLVDHSGSPFMAGEWCIDLSGKKPILIIENTKIDQLEALVKNIYFLFLLIDFLEDKGLMHTFDDSQLRSFGCCPGLGGQVNCINMLPAELQILIEKYAKRFFFVSEDLKVLCDNGFKTSDQVQYEHKLAMANRQLSNAKLTSYVSLFGLVISIIVSGWNVYEQKTGVSSIRVKEGDLNVVVDRGSYEGLVTELGALDNHLVALHNASMKSTSDAGEIRREMENFGVRLSFIEKKIEHIEYKSMPNPQ